MDVMRNGMNEMFVFSMYVLEISKLSGLSPIIVATDLRQMAKESKESAVTLAVKMYSTLLEGETPEWLSKFSS